jgi:L-threonylcarbamoyladenylate synthase
MSRVLTDDKRTREIAAEILADGGVLAFRTDTFYGLGADPFNREALRKINSLKGREGGKPILLIISDSQEAARLIAARTELFDKLAKRHWPGPLTLVAAAHSDAPDELTAGSGTIGVRLPDDEEVRAFVRNMGGALTATSANLAGEPPARTAAEVLDYFPAQLDLIVDSGPAPGGLPSTVLDVSGPLPRLVREGVVTKGTLQTTLQELGVDIEL